MRCKDRLMGVYEQPARDATDPHAIEVGDHGQENSHPDHPVANACGSNHRRGGTIPGLVLKILRVLELVECTFGDVGLALAFDPFALLLRGSGNF